MSKKILITGGAGFIGSHLADDLLGHDYEVRVLDGMIAPERAGDQRWYVADTARLREATGWRPAVDVETGVAELQRWLAGAGSRALAVANAA